MFFFFVYASEQIVARLESYLSEKRKTVYNIREITPRGSVVSGKLYWDKVSPLPSFAFLLGDPFYRRTLIINDGKKIVLNQEGLGQKDKVKPKNITDNPLAVVFKEKVKFVPHSDSPLRYKTESLGCNKYRVKLHRFSDLDCSKEQFVLDYQVVGSNIKLISWEIIMFGRNKQLQKRRIEFMSDQNLKGSPAVLNPQHKITQSDFS